MDGSNDCTPTRADSEPCRAKTEDRSHEQRIRYPISPVRIVAPQHCMSYGGIGKDCEERCQRRELEQLGDRKRPCVDLRWAGSLCCLRWISRHKRPPRKDLISGNY